jgi:hypothetical protein
MTCVIFVLIEISYANTCYGLKFAFSRTRVSLLWHGNVYSSPCVLQINKLVPSCLLTPVEAAVFAASTPCAKLLIQVWHCLRMCFSMQERLSN